MTKIAITAALAAAVLLSGCDLIHIKGQGKSDRAARAAAEAAKNGTPAPAVVTPTPDTDAPPPPTATNPNTTIEKVGTAGYCDVYAFERGGQIVYVASVAERRSQRACAIAVAPPHQPVDTGSVTDAYTPN